MQSNKKVFRSYLEATMQSERDGIISGNSKEEIIAWNQGAENIFGYKESEVIGKSLTILIPERYRAAHDAGIERVNNNGDQHAIGKTLELAGLHKNGHEFPIELSLLVWEEQGERFYGGVIRDISVRKQAQQKQELSELRFRSIAESANDAIISADSKGNIITWNEGARSIFGYETDEVMGKALTIIIPEEYRKRHDEGIERINNGGPHHAIGQTVELHGLRKDGTVFPVELSLATWQLGDDHFYSGIIRDITKRKELEARIKERSDAIKDLLDNTGQGFLSFDKQFKVHSEYSQACEHFFGERLTGKNVFDLLFFDLNEKEQTDLKELFGLLFDGMAGLEILSELLPTQIVHSEKVLKMEFRHIQNDSGQRLMVILTDVTLESRLQERLREDEEFKEIIVKVAMDKDGFVRFLGDLDQLLSDIEVELSKQLPDVGALFRGYHTIKGGAASYGLKEVSHQAHEIENDLDRIRTDGIEFSHDHKETMRQKNLELKGLLADALDRLSDIISIEERQQSGPVFRIPQRKLDDLRRFLTTQVVCENADLIKEQLEILCSQPITTVLNKFAKSAEELAQKLGKEVEVTMTGGEIELFFPQYEKLFATMIHLIRNSVDHGIETPDIREMLGKGQCGQLSIDVSLVDNNIQFLIIDDGAGIDSERIQAIAVQKGLLSENEAKVLSEEEALLLLFRPGFSTKEAVTEVSGRGVGMDAVKSEVDALNGVISIKTELDKGSTFTIRIPV